MVAVGLEHMEQSRVFQTCNQSGRTTPCVYSSMEQPSCCASRLQRIWVVGAQHRNFGRIYQETSQPSRKNASITNSESIFPYGSSALRMWSGRVRIDPPKITQFCNHKKRLPHNFFPMETLYQSRDQTKGSRKPCPQCPLTFQRREHLERHMRVHTGIKPYTCETCSRSFSRQDALNRHSKIHNKIPKEEEPKKYRPISPKLTPDSSPRLGGELQVAIELVAMSHSDSSPSPPAKSKPFSIQSLLC
jgi:uncharacterized Zn-finger protein